MRQELPFAVEGGSPSITDQIRCINNKTIKRLRS